MNSPKTLDERIREEAEKWANDRAELAKKAFPTLNPAGFDNDATREKFAFIAGANLLKAELEEKDKRIEELETALKEFDNDDNWIIENNYRDRGTKTGRGDWVYVGQWDPRVFSTHAIGGAPLANTTEQQRRKPSDFYEPGQPSNWAAREKIASLESKLNSAREALRGILDNVALDWYVQQFERPVQEHESGAVSKIHNHATLERIKIAFYNAGEALAAIDTDEKASGK
jgi:hypothetical protein